MKNIISLTALFVCLQMTFSLQGQSFLSTNGTAIVNEQGDTIILRGMGLGGWMLQEGYMLQTAGFAGPEYQIRNKIQALIGEENTDLFYDKWLENHVRKADIDSLKAWGFNSVRLPMHYKLYTPPIEEEPVIGEITWLDKGFELTDSLLSWCQENELYLILDLHGAPGGQGANADISDYDPTKPSLWESQRNKDKTVALWHRLAERYADEPWIGGYDLLNEVNWNLPGGTALRQLYEEITDSIRTVDNNHIIYIEGNWFANDFTGLTPPWDDNMVYSPHKYWSFNGPDGIDWVLPLRDNHNVPLWFGEAGENSNTWFRDAIKLMENNGIGWAWWPMKKVESIAGPLSIEKSPEYQTLLDYWGNGGTAPSEEFAFDALMDLTEKLKIENCFYQKDVIDAMFRQVQTDETLPFAQHTVPGLINAADFDLGRAGKAYHDFAVATYHVNTGNFTAWNTGWSYRNDGVDLEYTDNVPESNGVSVGWMDGGEWMQYTVDVEADAIYDLRVHIAADSDNGKFSLRSGDAPVSGIISTPNTGGWNVWEDLMVEDIILTTSDNKLVFYVEQEGFNLSHFELIQVGEISSLQTEFLSAQTFDENTVELVLNKPLIGPVSTQVSDFELSVNGFNAPIQSIALAPDNARIIYLTLNGAFQSGDIIKISYSGSNINAIDNSTLNTFFLEDVQNNIPSTHPIPGRIEAEDFSVQQGIVLETTSDTGGGQNAGFLDPGDFMEYLVTVAETGTYQVAYRNASDGGSGGLKLQLVDEEGFTTDLDEVNFSSTGGWQTWTTTNSSVQLSAGIQKLRIEITQSPFNLNWFEFSLLDTSNDEASFINPTIFPNPSSDRFLIQADLTQSQDLELRIVNNLGQVMMYKQVRQVQSLRERLDLSAFPAGQYFLEIESEEGEKTVRKIIVL